MSENDEQLNNFFIIIVVIKYCQHGKILKINTSDTTPLNFENYYSDTTPH